jgi:hypothetical protein
MSHICNRHWLLAVYAAFLLSIMPAAASSAAPTDVEKASGPCKKTGIVEKTIRGETDDYRRFVGRKKADRCTGTKFRDLILGRGGDDNLAGVAGKDILLGMDGDDTLRGGTGGDTLGGGPGIDHLLGFPGPDWLDGGKGADNLDGGGGADHLAPTTWTVAKVAMICMVAGAMITWILALETTSRCTAARVAMRSRSA